VTSTLKFDSQIMVGITLYDCSTDTGCASVDDRLSDLAILYVADGHIMTLPSILLVHEKYQPSFVGFAVTN